MPRAYLEDGVWLKLCIKCAETKETSEFRKQASKFDGLQSWCTDCKNEYDKKYYVSNRARNKEIDRIWRAANPDKITGYRLRFKYGMTVADYAELYGLQVGLCGCCADPLIADFMSTQIDHDNSHPDSKGLGKREAVRGILCRACNEVAVRLYENGRHMASYLPVLQVKAYLANPPAWQLWGIPDYIKERELVALAA